MMIIFYFILAILLSAAMFFLKNKLLNQVFSLLFLGVQSSLSIYAFMHINASDSVYFLFDSLGIILSMVLALLSFATFYHSRLYFKRHPASKRNESLYYAALILLLAAMNGAYFAEHLGILWACIEATTLSVAALIYHERTNISIEATWKYIFVSSIGIAIAFAGILFLGMAANSKGLTDLNTHQILAIAKTIDPLWLKVSFVLVLAGYSAKMGLFPLHTMAVDAHTVAPSPISALISTALMNVGFLGIYRVYTIVAQTDALGWAQNVLLICGMISISISTVQLLKVKHFKRMFAFSSLEHMGIIAMALALGGVGYYAAIFHLVLHSFAKASLFYQIGQVNDVYHSYMVKDTGQYIKMNPLGAVVVILAFLSISAIPPSGLFISEFMVFKSLFIAKNYLIIIAVSFLLAIIIFVFAKNLFYLLYYTKDGEKTAVPVKTEKLETVSQFLFIGLIVYLGVNPPDFLNELINSSINILRVNSW